MKIYTLDSTKREIKEVDIALQANTIYSFFSSILIDEIVPLNAHALYSDGNALNERKIAYFIGERLVIGDAVIIGKNGMEEVDVSIPKEMLSGLINYDLPAFYADVLELLSQSEINLYKTFLLNHAGENIPLSAEWVLFTFNMADERTKQYFIENLKQTLQENQDIEAFVQKMASLALKASR